MAIIYLDEQMVGASPSAIGYPNLITCVGITAGLSNGWLVGAHSTETAEGPDLCGKIWDCIKLVNANVVNAGRVEWLCLTGCLTKHPGGDPRAAYSKDFGQSASADGSLLSGNLDVKLYDIFAVYGESTFAVVTQNGTGQMPGVDYKRNSKMEYSAEMLSKGSLANFDSNGFWFAARQKLPFVKVGGFRKGKAAAPKGGLTVGVLHSAGPTI
ncbi:MAG: hypothetical protein KGL59_03300 [Acidobacteriota bacterium]|nr:hypothetical protein [Acidobacteriota bacterium]